VVPPGVAAAVRRLPHCPWHARARARAPASLTGPTWRNLLCGQRTGWHARARASPVERGRPVVERAAAPCCRSSACGSEVIFGRLAALPLHWTGSSLGRQGPPTRPRHRRALPCAGEEEQVQKNHPRGWWSPVRVAHLADDVRRNWHQAQNAGCRASKGRFPPPLWMSAGSIHLLTETIAADSKGVKSLAACPHRLSSSVR
jgi:hypothetical protein